MHVGSSRKRNLRARGSMGYLKFARLVTNLWAEAHPDIPILPTGGAQDADYPCILYGLELRQTHRSDPKMRIRETIHDDGKAYIVSGQRFQNVVSFEIVTEKNPVLAEEIIEVFEDFMLEMTPVFKEAGASEFVYSRRYADDEEGRAGTGVTTRKVSYLLTTEKVVSVETEKLESILLRAVSLASSPHASDIQTDSELNSTISTHSGSTFYNSITPRYYTIGGSLPMFFWDPNDPEYEDTEYDLFKIPRTGFVIGDRVYLSPNFYRQEDFPPNLTPGFYIIRNVVGNPWHADVRYELTDDNGNPVDFGVPAATPDSGEWVGDIRFIPETNVDVVLQDAQATPNT